jgi:hypothetical protein
MKPEQLDKKRVSQIERGNKMVKTAKDTYFETRDENGDVILCPIAATEGVESEDCVEEDVVRRYSGNIRVETTFLKGN